MNEITIEKLFGGNSIPSSPFEKLPKMLFQKIFSHLNLNTLSKLFSLNKFFLKLLCDSTPSTNQIWRNYLDQTMEEAELDELLKEIKRTKFEEKLNKYCLFIKYFQGKN